MMNLFKRSAPSKDIARDRLKMILVTDRIDSSTHVIEMMKNDILKVLQKYLDIDENELDIQISQQQHENGNGAAPRLRADIPIKSVRKR